MKWGKKKRVSWEAGAAASAQPATPSQRLGAGIHRSWRGLVAPLRGLVSTGGSIPGRLVSFGEVLIDLSLTPVGRIVTATLALTGAWLLLK